MGNKEKNIVCFGAGPAFKGGMSDYNTSLAKSLLQFENVKVHVVSWSQQYPSIVPREFKDKVSSLDFLEGSNISIKYITNYNNPFSWASTVKYISSLNPDKVIIQWSISIQGIPIGYIVKKLKKICNCEVIIDLHFVIQKEQSKIDKRLTIKGISLADTYIVHAYKAYKELKEIFPKRKFYLTKSGERNNQTEETTVIKLFHPVYDLYKPDPLFNRKTFKEEAGLKEYVFLFFGFIRRYKGLHNAIKAFEIVSNQRDDVSFLICGESFWNTLEKSSLIARLKKVSFLVAKSIFLKDEKNGNDYNPLTLIDELNLKDKTKVVNTFIPNEDVNKYFQASNASVLFYSKATPSGIESLSYNFNLPILTTRVGHFPEVIINGKNGYMAKDNTVESMAETMIKFLENPIPSNNVAHFKKVYSWKAYSAAILNEKTSENKK